MTHQVSTSERGFHCRRSAAAPIPVDDFAASVAAGLGRERKTLPARFLYDAQGWRLFADITKQPEYYLDRCENEILRRHADDIAAAGGGRSQVLIELGPGDGSKARVLVDALLKRQGRLTFHPVDASATALRQGCSALAREFHSLNIEALATSFEAGVASIFSAEPEPALIALLGPSFSNYGHDEALRFLGQLRSRARPFDLLLLGLDLKKDEASMLKAHDDAAGITARFHLNLLKRINRELQGDFPGDGFEYQARYDAEAGRVEMHLRSLQGRFVRVEKLDRYFWFEEGETLWTESAYKYSPQQIAGLCTFTGWNALHQWVDAASRFAVLLLAPSPNRGLYARGPGSVNK
jgi:L-histidine Nalpha-methyltransferase